MLAQHEIAYDHVDPALNGVRFALIAVSNTHA
jgi:hypothetical protein